MTAKERARLAWAVAQVDAITRMAQKQAKPLTGRMLRVSMAVTDVRRVLLGVLSFDPLAPVEPLTVMTPRHPRWRLFIKRLEGQEGCNFRRIRTLPKRYSWDCKHNHAHATKLLRAMGCDVPTSITFFRLHGGFCDCEVLFNVKRSFDRMRGRARPLSARRRKAA